MKTRVAFYFGCITLLLLFAVENVAGQVCSPSPCLNGGSCVETSKVETGFVCMCSSNFTGETCETALSGGHVMCGFNTCGNGGTCVITSGAIECTCTTDFTGPECDTPVDIIPSTAFTSAPQNTTQRAGSSKELTTNTATTSKTIRQTPSGATSNVDPSEGDLWIIIAIPVAAAVVVILVVILIICVIRKGKSSSGKSRTTSTPHMIADFTHHANRDNNTTNPTYTNDQRNTGYDDEELDDEGLDDDYPPPSYNESNMNEDYTFADSNQFSHVNNLDYDRNSDGDSLNALNTDYKFDMY